MRSLLFTVAAVCACAPCAATQQLIADLNQRPATSGTGLHTIAWSAGALAYFGASDASTGIEPWVTNGSAAGTRRLRDINPFGNAVPTVLGTVGGITVIGTTEPAAIWTTDGTEAGTDLLLAMPDSRARGPIGQIGNNILFSVRTDNGVEIWRTDLTPGGTALLNVSTGVSGSSALVGNRLVFTAADAGSGAELWYTDAATSATGLLVDVVPGPATSFPRAFTALNGLSYFLITSPNQVAGGRQGTDLWRTDGTAAGTVFVAATNLQTTGSELMVAAGGALLMRVNNSLLRHDGQLGSAVTQVAPGVLGLASDGTTAWFCNAGSLFQSDGSSNPPQLVAANAPLAVVSGTIHQNRYYARTIDGLYVSDGTAAGSGIAPLLGASLPSFILPLGNRVLVGDNLFGFGALWFTDGTAARTDELYRATFPAGITVTKTASVGDRLFLALDDGTLNNEVWVTDGTAAGTHVTRDINPGGNIGFGAGNEMIGLDDILYFTAVTPSANLGLWRTDGTTAGTTPILQTVGGQPALVTRLQTEGRDLYFQERGSSFRTSTVWRTDGTPSGTAQVPFTEMAASSPYVVLPDAIVFEGVDFDLWSSDGTAAGRMALTSNAGSVQLMNEVSGRAVAVMSTLSGIDLYGTDGTVAGTELLAQGLRTANFQGLHLVEWRDRLAIFADDEVIVTDGTIAGTTRRILQLPAGRFEFVANEDAIWFVAADAQNGRELWRTEGTPATTVRVTQLGAGPIGGVHAVAVPGRGSQLFLTGSDGRDGAELYVSDGTQAGTSRIADLHPNGSSFPEFIGLAGDRVIFLANDAAAGRELWSMPLALIGNTAQHAIGRGCPGSRGVPDLAATSLPHVDGSLDLRLQNARALSFAAFQLGTERNDVPLSAGCFAFVSGVTTLDLARASFDGVANIGYAVPNDPSAVGVSLFVQGAVFDPFGAAVPGVATSNGLHVVLGR